MAKRTLNNRQLQRRARRVYGAVAGVFSQAQLSGRPKKDAELHKRDMVSWAARSTAFVNDAKVKARLEAFFENIEIGRPYIQKNPGHLTPSLATEFLHKWKMQTPESVAGQFMPHAVLFYFAAKMPKTQTVKDLRKREWMMGTERLQASINAANKAAERYGKTRPRAEALKIKTHAGELDMGNLGKFIGIYAFRLEKRIGIRNCGLFFIALIDAGMTVKQAERRIKQIAKIRKKQVPRL